MHFLETYNPIDLFIIGTLLTALVLGIWKGFVRSLTALAGVVLGFVLAFKYYPVVQPYLSRISSLDPLISMLLSMVIVFIGVQIVFLGVRKLLAALIDLTRLSWLDRSLGAVMGLSAGFLIVAAAVQLVLMGFPEWPLVKTARLVRPVDRMTEKAMSHAPKSVRDQAQLWIAKWKGMQEPSRPAAARQSAPVQKQSASSQGVVK
jgi:membrane protein required for colicin V production